MMKTLIGAAMALALTAGVASAQSSTTTTTKSTTAVPVVPVVPPAVVETTTQRSVDGVVTDERKTVTTGTTAMTPYR